MVIAYDRVQVETTEERRSRGAIKLPKEALKSKTGADADYKRGREYRCDKQTAQANLAAIMSKAKLQMSPWTGSERVLPTKY